MANTMDKFRALSASLKADAAALRRDRVYMCCVGTYEYAAAHIDAILCESEAQEDAGAAEAKAWLLDVMGTWDFTIPTEAFNKIVNRIAARATPRTEPAEGREAVGADDSITLTDVASVLGEIAEGFDGGGGEYAITDETRRVLIDFAHGTPEHPLFNAVGHYFAQNPVPGTTPPADDGARVTDVMVREALAHCPHDLPPPARWEWIADKINAYMADPSQMDRDDAESAARVAALLAAREGGAK